MRHVWDSPDQLMLIRGGAGTGKTTMMTPALARLGAPAVLLAPSSDASRGQLREGRILGGQHRGVVPRQREDAGKGRGGGIIWVDEAGLLPIRDLDRLCRLANELDARIVLQGDPRQHKCRATARQHADGAGGLCRAAGGRAQGDPAPERRLCRRRWRRSATATSKKGDAILRKLGWVVEGQGHDRLVEEYAAPSRKRSRTARRKPCWSSTRPTRTATG